MGLLPIALRAAKTGAGKGQQVISETPTDKGVDDVPADDVPADDVPADDVPADDVPAPDVPAQKVEAPPAGPLSAFEMLEQQRAERLAEKAATARRQKELLEFRESRGAVDLKTPKLGKRSRWYDPFGWTDRPAMAKAQPVSEVDWERKRYGLGEGGMTDEGEWLEGQELSKGQMFAPGWRAQQKGTLPATPARISTRLEAGIANIQRKQADNEATRDDLNAKISKRQSMLALFDELGFGRDPPTRDYYTGEKRLGGPKKVPTSRPTSDEASRLHGYLAKAFPGEAQKGESSFLPQALYNREGIMELYDEIKEELDALMPEFRRAKLRSAQLMMAEDKYESMYMNMPTDNPDKQPK